MNIRFKRCVLIALGIWDVLTGDNDGCLCQLSRSRLGLFRNRVENNGVLVRHCGTRYFSK